jgi:hypothetical protein
MSIKKKIKKKVKKSPGRPVKYREEFDYMTYIACREGGFTDPKLAALFSVSRALINEWKLKHPKFKAALVKGKDEYDTNNVQDDLLKNARGFRYTETTKEPELVTIRDKDTGRVTDVKEVMKVVKTVDKMVVPNVKAQIYWLNNRNPNRWKHTIKVDVDGGLVIRRTKKRYDGESDDK